jgi:glycosyltransferase involved in cell wall biosynthesis
VIANSVLQLVLGLSPGGTERLVIEISKRLARRVRTTVCCLDEPGAWAHELTSEGIEVVSLRRTAGFHPALGHRIAAIAARCGARVLHCHHYSPFVYGRLAALCGRGVRVVFTEHGRLGDGPPSWKRRLVNPLLSALPASVCAVSEHLKAHMVAEGFAANRVQVVYNGIEPGQQPRQEDRQRARQTLGLPSDTLVVGTTARLDVVKDLGTLVEGFALVRAAIPGARLVMIGEGPERERLESSVRLNGLADAVLFTGARNDVRALLPAFDVYINSSTTEGTSLAILEAMAAGLPVVATRVGGTPEVVVDGMTGLLCPPRSAAGVATAVQAVLGTADRRSTLGAAGRRRVERVFSIDRMIAQYFSMYGVATGEGTA